MNTKDIFRLSSTLMLMLYSIYADAQYCTSDNRFTEVQYFNNSDIKTDSNIVYGNANDYLGSPEDLIMDIWQPTGPNETLSVRPFILLIHGGGFINGDRSIMSVECKRFAQRGYVAATIDYRKGWNSSNPNDGEFVAAYRAQQDAKAALRYIISNANIYGIDTSWMFMGGISAGAGTSLNTVFVNEAEWEATIPGITSVWGGLDTSGNSLTNTFKIKAVYNVCGITGQFAIQSEDMVPIISFHGYLDAIAPIGTTPQGTSGSSVIHDSLVANGVCSELNVDSLGYHCPHEKEFRINRTVCFFKSIFCNTCTTHYLTDTISAICSTPPLGIENLDFKNYKIEIYPNPFNDKFNVSGELKIFQIEIINSLGQSVQTVLPSGNLQTIDISNLPCGLYFVKVKRLNDSYLEVKKIIKQ